MAKNQAYQIQIDADEMKIIADALESYHTENLKLYKKNKEKKPWEYDYIHYMKNLTEKEMLLIEKWNYLIGKIIDETGWLPF